VIMQFQVPQFIDIENKIVGPLTLRQFLYFAAAGGLSFLFFFIFASWLWLLISLILFSVAAAFAFIKYNGQPLVNIAFNALMFSWKPRLYLWQRESQERAAEIPELGERKNLEEYFSRMPSVRKLFINLMTSRGPIPKREKTGPASWGRQKEKTSAFRKMTGEKEIVRRIDYR